MPSKSAFRTVLLLAALSACVGQAGRPSGAAPAAASQTGQFKNLEVLPDSISREALLAVMRNFTGSLGVRCTHCHVAYPGAPDSLNFASDDKETKRIARGMMRMVREINGDLMPGIPELADNNRVQVGCITCHRGAARPVMLEDTLATVARGLGVDSAVAAYRALRTQHYGRFTYDFGERSLNTLATRLTAEGRQADARRILELNAEQFPNSAGAAFELGRAYEAAGDRDRAIAQYRRALTLQPNNRGAQERLRALGQQP
jgi:hypothetical protein